MQMSVLVAVAAGGALGALGRYLVIVATGALVFPWATVLVNVMGSTAMGVLAGFLSAHWVPGPEMRAFLTVGLLGGFTTFSAFSLDAVTLMERGAVAQSVFYVGGSVLLSLLGLAGGLRLARAVVA